MTIGCINAPQEARSASLSCYSQIGFWNWGLEISGRQQAACDGKAGVGNGSSIVTNDFTNPMSDPGCPQRTGNIPESISLDWVWEYSFTNSPEIYAIENHLYFKIDDGSVFDVWQSSLYLEAGELPSGGGAGTESRTVNWTDGFTAKTFQTSTYALVPTLS